MSAGRILAASGKYLRLRYSSGRYRLQRCYQLHHNASSAGRGSAQSMQDLRLLLLLSLMLSALQHIPLPRLNVRPRSASCGASSPASPMYERCYSLVPARYKKGDLKYFGSGIVIFSWLLAGVLLKVSPSGQDDPEMWPFSPR